MRKQFTQICMFTSNGIFFDLRWDWMRLLMLITATVLLVLAMPSKLVDEWLDREKKSLLLSSSSATWEKERDRKFSQPTKSRTWTALVIFLFLFFFGKMHMSSQNSFTFPIHILYVSAGNSLKIQENWLGPPPSPPSSSLSWKGLPIQKCVMHFREASECVQFWVNCGYI